MSGLSHGLPVGFLEAPPVQRVVQALSSHCMMVTAAPGVLGDGSQSCSANSTASLLIETEQMLFKHAVQHLAVHEPVVDESLEL